MFARNVFGGAVVGLFIASSAFAQPQTVRSTSTVPCSGCRLQIDSITTVGGGEQEGAWFGNMVKGVVVTAANELIVASFNPLPAAFDLNGRFLRTVGRTGKGEGEFSGGPAVASVANGDLHFASHNRVTVFKPNGTFDRDIRISGSATNLFVLSDGKIVGTYPDFLPFTMGRPPQQPLLRLFDSTGKMLRQVGSNGVIFSSIASFAGVGGTMWTGLRAPFVLSEWAQDGTLLRRFERTTPTFDARPDVLPKSTMEFVQPHLLGAWQTPDGLLWAIYNDTAAPKACGVPYERCQPSVVEVLDPSTGALIASQRFASTLQPAGAGHLARIENTSTFNENGRVHITLYSVKLIHPAASPSTTP